jgi:hypothetical protein
MLWPAIYNGFPLLYPDSMTYLDDGRIVARAVFLHKRSGYYGMRSFFYSLGILPFHWNLTVWPVVVLQSLLMAYVLWLVMRAVVPRWRLPSYLALMLVLSATTSLSWYVTLVLPDFLGPAVYLCIFLLVFASETLSRLEKASLYLIAWWGITSHATHLLLAAGLWLLLALLTWLQKRPQLAYLRAVGSVGIVLLAAAAAQLALHGYLYGEPSLNGQRPPFLTARVIADGPGRWYLEKHCGEVKWVVCDHLKNLSSDPDNLLWGSDGLWQNLSDQDGKRLMREEMPFVLATLRTYPQEQFSRSAANFWGQLQTFGYDDLDPSSWVLDEFDTVLPAAKQSYMRSRQARNEMPLELFATIQNWTVLVSLALIAVLMPMVSFGRTAGRALLTGLSVVVFATVVANALITGTLSMVEDRLQSRIVWLVPLLAGLLVLELLLTDRPIAKETLASADIH